MNEPNNLSRLDKLKQRQAKLAAEIARAEKAEREQSRSRETRRKIVAGAVVLAWIEDDPAMRTAFLGELDRRVTRPHDRTAVADLLPVAPPLPG